MLKIRHPSLLLKSVMGFESTAAIFSSHYNHQNQNIFIPEVLCFIIDYFDRLRQKLQAHERWDGLVQIKI